METIVGVAMLLRDGEVLTAPKPKRHHHIFRDYYDEHNDVPLGPIQGFVTDTGRFVDREEAWKIAEAAGQLIERAPTDGRGGTLYSEDVW